jgi:5-methylcytosine-specific restriction endonuclease McrA
MPAEPKPAKGTFLIERRDRRKEVARACVRCGKTLTQARTMKPGRWARVQYCSLSCARVDMSERFAERRKHRTCALCGSPRAATAFTYCSKACEAKARTKPRKICDVCRINPVSRGGKYCGSACSCEARKRQHRSQRVCPICSSQFWPRRYSNGFLSKCCSRACENTRRHIGHEHIIKPCSHCGVTVRRFKGNRKAEKFFCSVECRRTHMRGPNSPLYRGHRDPNRGRGWAQLAREMRLRDNHTCQRCGDRHQDGMKTFPVDHIIPWRCFVDKWSANDPSNLATLCPKCHQYKTLIVERRYLRGDVLPMEQYRRSLRLSAVERSA